MICLFNKSDKLWNKKIVSTTLFNTNKIMQMQKQRTECSHIKDPSPLYGIHKGI